MPTVVPEADDASSLTGANRISATSEVGVAPSSWTPMPRRLRTAPGLEQVKSENGTVSCLWRAGPTDQPFLGPESHLLDSGGWVPS